MYANSFVGREADLEAVRELLTTNAKLVTLTGPGGVGKTRLASEFSKNNRQLFSKETHFVELARCSHLEDAITAIARSIGVTLLSARSSEDVITLIGRTIAGKKRTLIVLDNLEHLTDALAPAIERWVADAPEARWLLTSRERLRLAGEHPYELEPLIPKANEQPEHWSAVQLFFDRAKETNARFQPAPGDASLVAEIVQSLDGLPLAIELAAARTGVLSLSQIRERLRDRFALLASGRRGAEARQATLRAAIDWSWNLLAAKEQHALAAVSVFRGGFTLAAAEAVFDSAEALELLQELRDKSLLRMVSTEHDTEARFALYESVRAYAAERLETLPMRDDSIARHAAWFVREGQEHAEAITGTQGVAALRWLAREHDNLVAVAERGLARNDAEGIRWAFLAVRALDPLWQVRGPSRARLLWAEKLLARLEPMPSDEAKTQRAWMLLSRGLAHKAMGDWSAAAKDFETVCSVAQEQQNQKLEGRALGQRATAYAATGRLAEAEKDFSAAISLLVAAKDTHAEGTVRGNHGVFENWHGRHEAARKELEQALALHRALGDRHSEGIHLGRLAILQAERGHRSEARSLCRKALELLHDVGDTRFEAGVWSVLGIILQEDGEFEEAAGCEKRAAEMQRSAGDRYSEALAIYYGARVAQERGAREEALDSYERALQLFEERGDQRNVALIHAALAALEATHGTAEAAERSAQRAETIARESKDELRARCVGLYRGHVELAQARAALQAGRPAEASALVSQAERRAREAEPLARDSDDVRFALRLLRAALSSTPAPEEALRAGRDGSWFEVPGQPRASLAKRKALRLLFRALIEARESNPGASVSRDTLTAAGWPGEKIRTDAAANRLYVAITTLRQLGLKGVLINREEGWTLDPAVPLVLSEETES